MAAVKLKYLLIRRNLFLSHAYRQGKVNKNKKRRFWIRGLYQERDQKGEYILFVRDLWLYDHEIFFKYFRMMPNIFENLIKLIALSTQRKTTKMREPIGVDQRLLVTLRYLATGDARSTIAANYRMSLKLLLEENNK